MRMHDVISQDKECEIKVLFSLFKFRKYSPLELRKIVGVKCCLRVADQTDQNLYFYIIDNTYSQIFV